MLLGAPPFPLRRVMGKLSVTDQDKVLLRDPSQVPVTDPRHDSLTDPNNVLMRDSSQVPVTGPDKLLVTDPSLVLALPVYDANIRNFWRESENASHI